MKTLRLTDGDIAFEMVEADEELAQSVRVILSTRLGEFELDQTVGLDRGSLRGKQFDEDEARYDIVEALSQEDRIAVVESVEFNIDHVNRKLSVSVVVQKEDGGLITVGSDDFVG